MKAVKALIQAGADVSLQYKAGETALDKTNRDRQEIIIPFQFGKFRFLQRGKNRKTRPDQYNTLTVCWGVVTYLTI